MAKKKIEEPEAPKKEIVHFGVTQTGTLASFSFGVRNISHAETNHLAESIRELIEQPSSSVIDFDTLNDLVAMAFEEDDCNCGCNENRA